MAIKRMISRDVEEFRRFQTRMVGVGRIRLGEYVVPEGRRGRPVKLDRFRLTSPNEDYIRTAAKQYGGEVRQYQPQGGGPAQWEVITATDALYVYIVNGQNIDPVYEAWGAGRTCIRRCDGEWNTVMQEACICNDPAKRPPVKDLCKITTRVNVMLPNVAGLNSWRLEHHSENAAVEMAAPNVAGLVRVAPMPVPATLRLRKEQRRERNHEKGTFETKDFYVPWFDINVVSAEQLVGGREGFAQALIAGGAPALMAAPEDRRAIEAYPVSAPVPPPAVPEVDDALRAKILGKIERQETVEGLEEVKALLKEQGITDQAVIDAWKSKLAAVQVAAAPHGVSDDDLADAVDNLTPEQRNGQAETLGQINDQFAADLDDAISGTVESTGSVILPDVPGDDYDTDEVYTSIMTAAGRQTPPLTTAEVNALICRTFEVETPSFVSGHGLARLRAGLKSGAVQWR